MPAQIALIGDYSPSVTAHRAIPRALDLARAELNVEVGWPWIETRALVDVPRVLAPFSAFWVAPASPYENMAGVLAAIRFARESRRPFLGTCGGFQHAVIEFARHVAGLPAADHAETNPAGDTLAITPLACALVEATGRIYFVPGSRLHTAYGAGSAEEGYHCRYGVSAAHRSSFERSGLVFTAVDSAGDIRGAELPGTVHPFFVGTLFQPERAALRGLTPPLVRAFLAAAVTAQGNM